MKLSEEIRNRAVKFRKQGYSLAEISYKLGISKSTASVWLRDIKLSKKAKNRIKRRSLQGQRRAAVTKKRKMEVLMSKYRLGARVLLEKFSITLELSQVFCALLYWAEGAKFTDNRLEFTNSDPEMIRAYLKLLRKGFKIDERKLRVNIHLHHYHEDLEQKRFWSEVTGIPLSQFNKSYIKPHTQKRKRENYPGCVRICYYSADTARKIKALYQEFINFI